MPRPRPICQLNSAWKYFYDGLLRDWSVRTLDPAEANMFFVPSFAFAVTGNLYPPHERVPS